MQDRPTLRELLSAVRGFLEDEVVPALEGRRRFHARVAANALAIAERELQHEEAHLRREWADLSLLLGQHDPPPASSADMREELARRNESLCARIKAGDFDSGSVRDELWRHLRRTVEEKLAVSDPRLARVTNNDG